MIVNMPTQYPKVIQELMNHPVYRFHLTGSRFFESERPSSDWDFFIDIDHVNGHGMERFKEFLFLLGFEQITDENYMDGSIEELWRYIKDGAGASQVDIQIILDAGLKSRVQSWMKKYNKDQQLASLPKSQRSRYWNQYLELGSIFR